MSDNVEVTVSTDDGHQTTVQVDEAGAREYERMVGRSPNVAVVRVGR